MNLGGRVEQERKSLGWSQQQLADKVSPRLPDQEKGGLTQQALDRLEKRDSKTSEFVVGLADALGVSLRWIISGEGRKSDRDWPFSLVDRKRWDACSDEERGYVQAAVNRALDECEARRDPPTPPTPEGRALEAQLEAGLTSASPPPASQRTDASSHDASRRTRAPKQRA